MHHSSKCETKFGDKGPQEQLQIYVVQISMETKGPDSPEPSNVSLKSNQSKVHPVLFKNEDPFEYSTDSQGDKDCNVRRCQSFERINPILHECSIDCQHCEVQTKQLKSDLKTKFQCIYEGTVKHGSPTLINEIYTELYITEGEGGELNNEDEIRRIEKVSRKTTTEDRPVNLNDIFKPLPGQDRPIRTVLTKGVAGIGKTVSVQKFIIDWVEGEANQDIWFIFPLPFRELNLLKDQSFSLKGLLQYFMNIELDISLHEGKIMFIFDGLDECRLPLDFQKNVRLCDVTVSASVDVLLTNLIVGNLLPSSLIWITSRPAAADLVPSECVHRVTEVRGFSDPQKEEYIRKKVSDQTLSDRIISHLKSSRSLYIMCHIPVFCWISATVLENMLSEAETAEIPKTLTQMYTQFLMLQTSIKHEKDFEKKVKDEDMVCKLGKLAFQQLMKGNVIFYEDDLKECGIDVKEASVYSGLCTQLFREEFSLCQKKVYSFVHLSVQEHLAALYGLLSFSLNNEDVFVEGQSSKHDIQSSGCFTVFERAVEEALLSSSGHLDLFLRFLLGLSVESNQIICQQQIRGTPYNKEEIIQYVKKKIRGKLSPEKSINLFHCLNELGDHTLENEIQDYLRAGTIKDAILSPSQWSALVFILLTSKKLEVFELKEYIRDEFNQKNITQDQVLHHLLPVVEASRSVQLGCCGLSENCCADLASALSSETSCMTELNLNYNNLQNSGVKLLSVGLGNLYCKLKTLWLWRCGITGEGCAALVSALNSNPSHLRELNLSENNLGNQGMTLFSDVLKNPECKLETLILRFCNLSDEGCSALASVLKSNPSLRELDLSENEVGDAGVHFLSDGLKNTICKLEILWLKDCEITDEGCSALATALKSNPSHLRELDLTKNTLTDTGINLLTAIKSDSHYKLEKLHFT